MVSTDKKGREIAFKQVSRAPEREVTLLGRAIMTMAKEKLMKTWLLVMKANISEAGENRCLYYTVRYTLMRHSRNCMPQRPQQSPAVGNFLKRAFFNIGTLPRPSI